MALVVVLEAHDVILAQVAAGLHFNQVKRRIADVFEAMLFPDGDVGGLVFVQQQGFLAASHLSLAGNHDPVFGAVLVFLQRARRVQGQGELAAVRATLGSLRTALITEHLRQQTQGRRVEPTVATPANHAHNPFTLVKVLPPNYQGEFPLQQVGDQLHQGFWAFVGDCPCVVYAPLAREWFDSPSGDTMLWYRLDDNGRGPITLEPQESYRWFDEVLR